MAQTTIYVSLDDDPTANPNLIIRNRDKNVRGNNIKWTREGDLEFEFYDLEGLPTALFPDQRVFANGKSITSKNLAPIRRHDYEYTLIVMYLGNEYNSTIRGVPPNPKPVIRNV